MKRLLLATGLLALLAACSTGSPRPKPADLPALTPTIGARQVWSLRLPGVDYPAVVQAHEGRVVLGAGDGTVLEIDAASGRELWRASAGAPLAAGVGSDGSTVAVVTRTNELVALREGRARRSNQRERKPMTTLHVQTPC